MDWLPALIAGIGLPAVAAAIGVAWRARTGRLRATPAADAGAVTDAAALELAPAALGSAATLVQFSTEYCSRCPSTARQLAGVASHYDGVLHLEVDLTRRPDLADRFNVLQTPTTIILDARGLATARIGGVPRLGAVHDHLDRLTGRNRVTS